MQGEVGAARTGQEIIDGRYAALRQGAAGSLIDKRDVGCSPAAPGGIKREKIRLGYQRHSQCCGKRPYC